MWCWHIWEILKTDIQSAPIDSFGSISGNGGKTRIPNWMFNKKVIVTKRCKKCQTERVEIKRMDVV